MLFPGCEESAGCDRTRKTKLRQGSLPPIPARRIALCRLRFQYHDHMKIGVYLATALSFTALGLGASSPELVATGKNVAVERTTLEEAAAEELEQLELERLQFEAKLLKRRHQILQAKLEELVGRQLLTMEAAVRGMPPQQLISEIADGVEPPSPEEVENVYALNEDRFQEPKEKVLPQLETYLKQEKTREAVRNFIQVLRAKYDVEFHLEPLRFAVSSPEAPFLGPKDAPVEIVEFSDFQCPYCGAASAMLKRLREEFGDQVRISFRQFPITSIHPQAAKAAEASLCAAEQGEFWDMHDSLFSDQEHLEVDRLKARARDLGLDGEAFDSCLDSGKYAKQVQEDLKAGLRAGVDGTPAFFVNGRPFNGAVPYERLAEAIREELAEPAEDPVASN